MQVLLLAREMGMLKMGTVALDGAKVHANASKHSALSYEHAGKIEAQLKAEVAELMAKAEAADKADLPDGMSIPDELARREERLKKIAEARANRRRSPFRAIRDLIPCRQTLVRQAARAYPLLMESKAGSKFLFYRASYRKTASHFSGRTLEEADHKSPS